jgi:hypothetical protein
MGEFDRYQIPYHAVWLPCGHYTMGQFPFSSMVGYQTIKFLTS